MSDIKLTSKNTVRLGTLMTGALFLQNSAPHGHELGIIFSDKGVLALTGPDKFHAFHRGPNQSNEAVLQVGSAQDLSVRVPRSHTFTNRESVKIGRMLVDEDGIYITAQWAGGGGFVRVRIDCLAHDADFRGMEIDQWELVTTDRFGNVSVVAFHN